VKRALGLVAALWLGCSPAPRPGSEPKAHPQPADARPLIVAFGDSLTAGFNVDPGESYPDYLQQMLDAHGYRYRVVNAGISGDTTGGGLDRVDSILAMKPVLAILALGGNDGLRGLPLERTRANLDAIVDKLAAAGVVTVSAGITLPRNYGPDYIAGFEKIYRDLAERRRLPFIPFLLEGVAGVPGLMQGDGIHPTAEGNRRVAESVFKTIQPLLDR